MNEYTRLTVTLVSLVLIDTWWNVNSRQQLSYFPEQFVLIDTWWNVNPYTSNENAIGWSVLIDTWWNVNAEDCHTLILTDTF